jgi:hypothetical protein
LEGVDRRRKIGRETPKPEGRSGTASNGTRYDTQLELSRGDRIGRGAKTCWRIVAAAAAIMRIWNGVNDQVRELQCASGTCRPDGAVNRRQHTCQTFPRSKAQLENFTLAAWLPNGPRGPNRSKAVTLLITKQYQPVTLQREAALSGAVQRPSALGARSFSGSLRGKGRWR